MSPQKRNMSIRPSVNMSEGSEIASVKRKKVFDDQPSSNHNIPCSLFTDVSLKRDISDTRLTGTLDILHKKYFRLDSVLYRNLSSDQFRPPEYILKTMKILQEKWKIKNNRFELWRCVHQEDFKSIRQEFAVQRVGDVSAYKKMFRIELEFAIWCLICNANAALEVGDRPEFVAAVSSVPLLIREWLRFQPHSPLSAEISFINWICTASRLFLAHLPSRNSTHYPENSTALQLSSIENDILKMEIPQYLKANLSKSFAEHAYMRSCLLNQLLSRVLAQGLELHKFDQSAESVSGPHQDTWSRFSIACRTNSDKNSLSFLNVFLCKRWISLLVRMHLSELRVDVAVMLMSVTNQMSLNEYLRHCSISFLSSLHSNQIKNENKRKSAQNFDLNPLGGASRPPVGDAALPGEWERWAVDVICTGDPYIIKSSVRLRSLIVNSLCGAGKLLNRNICLRRKGQKDVEPIHVRWDNVAVQLFIIEGGLVDGWFAEFL